MRPEEAFWTFSKSDWRRMKRALDNQKIQDNNRKLMPPRKPYTRPYTEEEKAELREQLAQQLGSDSLTPEDDVNETLPIEERGRGLMSGPEFFNSPEFQSKLNRIASTSSTGNVGAPTPGTGFDTLTEKEKEDLKYNRRGGS